MNERSLYNLLAEPVLGVEGRDGRTFVSLPGLLERVGTGTPTELTALQPHQQFAMHAFLTQLGAIVATAASDTRTARDEAEWRDRLRALTGGDEAWCLVVPDLSKPAFMQPPVPEGSLVVWDRRRCPDEIDVLVTAKNHDVKQRRIVCPRPEHWVYALVSVQTMEGFSGRENYGIARMNGGMGNRPGLAAAPGIGLAERFARDVHVWLEARRDLLASARHGFSPTGISLLWVPPWDGAKSFTTADVDPLVIEVCRRIRITTADGRTEACRISTKTRRLDAESLNGDTGDAFTPVNRTEGKSLTLSRDGFTYRRLHDLIFDETNWKPAPAQVVRREDGDEPVLIARAVVRGQGKTEGLHERVVPIPHKARRLLETLEGRGQVGALSRLRIERTGIMRLNVLKPALLTLLQGGPDELRFNKNDKRSDPMLHRFETAVDDVFFVRLFDDLEAEPETRDAAWNSFLLTTGHGVLREAMEELPIPLARRYRAVAAAERTFTGGAFKQKFRTHKLKEGTTHD